MYRRIESEGCDKCEEQDFKVFKREFEALYPKYEVIPTDKFSRWDANIINKNTGNVVRRVEFKSSLMTTLIESPVSDEKYLVDWKNRDKYNRPTILKNIRIRKDKVDKLVELEKKDEIVVDLVWLFADKWVIMHACNDFNSYENNCYNGRDTNDIEVQYSIPINLPSDHDGRIRLKNPYRFDPPKYIESKPE